MDFGSNQEAEATKDSHGERLDSLFVDEEEAQRFICGVLRESGTYVGYVQARAKYGAIRDVIGPYFRFDVSASSLMSETYQSCGVIRKACSQVEQSWQTVSAVYVTTNPRDGRVAEYTLVREILARYFHADGPVSQSSYCHDLSRRWMELLTQHVIKQRHDAEMWWTLDIDRKDVAELSATLTSLNDALADSARADVERSAWLVSTRGGWHLLLRGCHLDKAVRAQLYKDFRQRTFQELNRLGQMMTKEIVNMKPDMHCPLPGTMQGGVMVTAIPLCMSEEWRKIVGSNADRDFRVAEGK